MRVPVFRESLRPPINLVPLVTVVLQMMLFFCCSNTWKSLEFSDAVALSHSNWGQEQFWEGRTWVVVNILRSGQMFVAGRNVDGNELQRLLRAERKMARSRDVGVVVRADAHVAYGTLGPEFRAAVRANVRHVNFALARHQGDGQSDSMQPDW